MTKIWSVPMSVGAAAALAFGLIVTPAATAAAQNPTLAPAPAAYQSLSADQLDNLVAPVALYADPLLAQVMLAATFPDQVQQAAQYVRANGTDGIDDQYWDVSVKAVAHYPTILNMMDQKIDWTTALGQAYAGQSSDVMQAVQHMRDLAQQQGNLQNTPQQQIVSNDGYISIWPAQPNVIYVPVYNPAVVYYQPMFLRVGFSPWFSFGLGYPIGPWLIYDWNWPMGQIYYTGWAGGGWIARSRPFIAFSAVYVNAGSAHIRYGSAGRYGAPSHGVLVNGGGYRQGQLVSGGAARRALVTRAPAPQRAAGSGAARTAQRGAYDYSRAPMAQPRTSPYARPQVVERRSYGGYSAGPVVQERRAQPAPQAAPRGGSSAPRESGGRTAHRSSGGHGH